MGKKIFITGISGFLASHTALQLLHAGAIITGSVRSMEKADHIRSVLADHGADTRHLSFVELDLMDDKGWTEAIRDHDYLLHIASPYVTSMPKDPQVLIQPAVEGTARALNAAMSADVKHIVLTSSMAAVWFSKRKGSSSLLTEEDWTDVNSTAVSSYALSKTLAEMKAWEIVENAGNRNILTVINPGFIMGPVLEKDIGTSGALIKKMLSGGFPGSPNIGFNCVDVRDAATVHIKALEYKEFYGRRILLAGDDVKLVEIAKYLAEAFPQYARKLPTRQLPDFLVKLIALFDGDAKTASKTLGRSYNLDSRNGQKLLGTELISDRKAAVDMAQSIIDLGLV